MSADPIVEVRVEWQKWAGFRRTQKMPSIHSSAAYLLFVAKNSFSCTTKSFNSKYKGSPRAFEAQ